MASQAFQDLKKKAKTIGVYGSVVEGTMDKLSDIDLWILTEKKLSLLEQERISNKLTNELNREVSLKAFTKESWQKLKQKDKIFFDELNYKSKILHGEMIA